MEKENDSTFNQGLAWKRSGGVALDVFVSDGIWLGGIHESRQHTPFIAIGPTDWEGEEELTFFSSRDQVESLIDRLREACDTAFGKTDG